MKRGADVKAATRYGVTPMGLAALNGNAAIMRTAPRCRRGSEHRDAGW